MSEKCPKCGAEIDRYACTTSPREMYECDSYSWLSGQFCQSDKCRIRELEAKLAKWKPLTPEEAEKAYDEAVAVPMSEDEINRIVKAAMDPAERLPNSEQMQLAARLRELEAKLAEYHKSAPLCDEHKPSGGARSGCMVCGLMSLTHALSRISYACGEPNEMGLSPFDLDYDEEHVVTRVEANVAELERQLAMYKSLHQHALKCVDDVFQEYTGHVPILPNYLVLGSDKFKGVVDLAVDYKKTITKLAATEQELATIRERLTEACEMAYDCQSHTVGVRELWEILNGDSYENGPNSRID